MAETSGPGQMPVSFAVEIGQQQVPESRGHSCNPESGLGRTGLLRTTPPEDTFCTASG